MGEGENSEEDLAKYDPQIPEVTKGENQIGAFNLTFSPEVPLSTFDALSVSILDDNDTVLGTNTLNKAGFYLYANDELDEKFVKEVSERNKNLPNFEGRADDADIGDFVAWSPDGDTTGPLTVRPFKKDRTEKYEGAPELDDGRVNVILGWDLGEVSDYDNATKIRVILEKDGVEYKYYKDLKN